MIMNKKEFLSSAGLQMQTLDVWLEQRWLIPAQTSAGANFSDIILHLVDQLHGMRRVLEQLRGDLGEPSRQGGNPAVDDGTE